MKYSGAINSNPNWTFSIHGPYAGRTSERIVVHFKRITLGIQGLTMFLQGIQGIGGNFEQYGVIRGKILIFSQLFPTLCKL